MEMTNPRGGTTGGGGSIQELSKRDPRKNSRKREGPQTLEKNNGKINRDNCPKKNHQLANGNGKGNSHEDTSSKPSKKNTILYYVRQRRIATGKKDRPTSRFENPPGKEKTHMSAESSTNQRGKAALNLPSQRHSKVGRRVY